MAYMQYPLACSLVLFLCVQGGLSLRCFECNSRNDSRCAQNVVPEELSRECPQRTQNNKPYTICRKIKQVIDFEVNGLPPDSRTIRACGWENPPHYKNRCYQRSGFGGRQEVCACESDLCNVSTQISTSLSLIALLASLKLFL